MNNFNVYVYCKYIILIVNLYLGVRIFLDFLDKMYEYIDIFLNYRFFTL